VSSSPDYNRRYRETNRERLREYNRRWREAHPGYHRRWREANRNRVRRYKGAAAQRGSSHAENRAMVFAHYGMYCACCGTEENLTIDHVGGKGREHRATIGSKTDRMYRWLIANDFPPGFQTLCVRCNSSKGRGEHCRMHGLGRLATLDAEVMELHARLARIAAERDALLARIEIDW
jgi:hypothetical protein